MFKLFTSLLIIISFAFSLNTKNQTNEPHFTKIIQGNHSNILKNSNIVINNDNELSNLLNKINAVNTNPYNKPNIDFNKQQVIGLFMGSQNIEGYKIKILNVTYNKTETIVSYFYMDPSATTKTKNEMIVSQPFILATIKKTNNPIKFIMAKC